MTEKDVMVGDYFRVNRECLCIKKDTIVEVRGIDADNKLAEGGLVGAAHCRPLDDDQFDGGIWLAYLEPIPLKPEILEKNGFKNVSVITVGIAKMRWVSEDTRTEITIWMDDTMPMEIVKNVYYEDEVSYTLPFPGCVHELQHAIRLCGISKDITL